MSRLAKRPIVLPPKTEVVVAAGSIAVKGPKGTLTRPGHRLIPVEVTQEGEEAARPRLGKDPVGFVDNDRHGGATDEDPFELIAILTPRPECAPNRAQHRGLGRNIPGPRVEVEHGPADVADLLDKERLTATPTANQEGGVPHKR